MSASRLSPPPNRGCPPRRGLVVAFLILGISLAGPSRAAMIGTGLAPRALAVGDLNGDGYADLVSGNTSDSTVTVSLGRGNGTYDPKVQYPCGASVTGVTIADLDGDGHLDVLSCAPSIGKIGVRFGAGDGTLGARTDISVSTPTAVVVADFDENGIPDLAFACTALPSPGILLGTGGGAFGPPTHYGGTGGPHLAVGDLNNDTHADVVVTNTAVLPYGAAVMLGNGTGSLAAPVLHVLPEMPVSLALADFNLDGDLDLAAVVGAFNEVYVPLGNGNGTFGPNAAYPTASSPSGIAVADLNGDVRPDLVVTATGAHVVSVLVGTGTGAFNPRVDYPAGVSPRGVVIAPLDGDAHADLAMAAGGSNSIATLPGNGNGTFQAPSGPVYVWAPASGIAFDPNAWLPARNSGTASDILVFNRGGAVTVSSIPTSTVGQLVISGGTEVSMSSFSGTATLGVAGGSGTDVSIERGSKGVLASGTNPVHVNIASGANGEINGDVEIRGGNSRFQALDVNGIVFQSTGRAIIGAGSSTTPFGDGTGASGLNSVLFHNGSRYIAQTTVAVFGAAAPNAVVVFWPGSRFRMDAAFTPAASGRTYADFEYNVPAGNTAISGGSPFQVDSLIVKQGTFTVAMTGPVTIRGNIVVNVCTGPNQLVFAPSTPATYRLAGASRQSLYSTAPSGCTGNVWRVYASPNVTWNIDNPSGVAFRQGWRTASSFLFTRGNVSNDEFWQLVADSASTLTGASQSTGWVASDLARRVTANGPLRFDVGDSANYLPVDVDMHGVTAPGYVLAGTYARDHSDFGRAQLDPAHFVHRTWVLTASNDFGNQVVPTYFGDLDATFAFRATDVDPGSDPFQFVARQHSSPSLPWRATTPGIRTATTTQALGLTPAAVDSFPTLAIGQPITPLLSVSDASEAEGSASASRVPVANGEVTGGSALAGSSGQPAHPAGGDAFEFAPPWRSVGTASGAAAIDAAPPARLQAAGSLTFRVRLSQAAVVPVSVDYATVDGTATVADGDYTPASGTLTIAAGDSAQDIVVPFGVDSTPERNETFGIVLSNATNAILGAATATGTILDDDDLVAPTAQVTSPNGGEVFYQNQMVNLTWTATDNVAVSGVDIQLVDGSVVTTLASNHPNTGSYSWVASGPASTKMRFRVVARDDPGHATMDQSDGQWELSSFSIGVDDELPLAFALAAPSPNPSLAGRSRLVFDLPREAHVRLTVHDVRGRRMAELLNGAAPAGRHARHWDSSAVAAGVYFVRLEAAGFEAVRRLVVVR